MELLDEALRLAEQAERDPVRAVQHAEKLRDLLARARTTVHRAPPPPAHTVAGGGTELLARTLARLEQVIEMAARPLSVLGCTHIVRVDDVPTLTPGTVTPALKIDWPGGEGIARAVFAGTTDGQASSLSQVSVRISINGTDDLATTGEAPAYVPLVAFQAANHNWFRLKDYHVSPAQKWTVYFQHEGPSNSNQVTPFLLFGFVQGK